MKNIPRKNLKILIGIVMAAISILNLLFFWLMLPLAAWYIAVIITDRRGKCRLYRWIIAGILFHPLMSGWGVWRATGSILSGLLAYLIIFLKWGLFRYLMAVQLFSLNEVYYLGLQLVFGWVLTFVILRWAWRRLPDEMKVYGWT